MAALTTVKGYHLWSQSEIDTLKTLYTGVSGNWKEISLAMGLSENAVKKKANKIGLKITTDKISWTEKENEYIRKHYTGRVGDWQKIAKVLDVSLDRLRRHGNRLGLKKPVDYVSSKDKANIIKLTEKHNTVQQIGIKLNLGRNIIRKFMDEAGIAVSDNPDFYRLVEVKSITGIPLSTLKSYVERGIIKAEKQREIWWVSKKVLVQFIAKYPTELRIASLDLFNLVDMLCQEINYARRIDKK